MDCHTVISQLLLSGLPVIVIQVTTGNNTQTSAFRCHATNRWNFVSGETYHLPAQQVNTHQSQMNYRYLLTLTYSNRFGKTRDLFKVVHLRYEKVVWLSIISSSFHTSINAMLGGACFGVFLNKQTRNSRSGWTKISSSCKHSHKTD